jgi:AAA domain
MLSSETEKLLENLPLEDYYSKTFRPNAGRIDYQSFDGLCGLILANNPPENFTLTDLIARPPAPLDWIFTDLWQAGTIGLFTGDGGVGKTHATLQVLRAIVSGGQIQNTPFICTKARPVVYITQEDEAEFIKQEFLTQDPTLAQQKAITDQIKVISTARAGTNLFLQSASDRNYLIGNITPGSVFAFDSWSTFIECNENDNTELIKEIRSLREIMHATESTALLIHHRPKATQPFSQSSFRGGTALPANCRFHIMLAKSTTKTNKGGVTLSFEKVSRAAMPSDIEMTFDPHLRLFVPCALDKYIACFTVGQQLTTTQVIQFLGLNLTDPKVRKDVLNALRYRAGTGGALKKVQPGSKGKDAVWERLV